METKIHNYGDNPITFALEKNNGMMVNATQMAKIFNKDLFQFTKSESTKNFIDACLKPANAGLLGIRNEADLITSRQKSGTFMHRVLALKFASWLSPDFELWVYTTIESILYGKLVKRDISLEESFKLSNEKKGLETKEDKTGDDFNRYLEIDKILKQEKTNRTLLTREKMTGMKDMFN